MYDFLDGGLILHHAWCNSWTLIEPAERARPLSAYRRQSNRALWNRIHNMVHLTHWYNLQKWAKLVTCPQLHHWFSEVSCHQLTEAYVTTLTRGGRRDDTYHGMYKSVSHRIFTVATIPLGSLFVLNRYQCCKSMNKMDFYKIFVSMWWSALICKA